MSNFGLWPLTKGYSTDYLDNFDPRITNEFSTAAFRLIALAFAVTALAPFSSFFLFVAQKGHTTTDRDNAD
jgi:hypothetical protein